MHSALQFDYYGIECELVTKSQFFHRLLSQKFATFISGATKSLTQQKIIIEFHDGEKLPKIPNDAVYLSKGLCQTSSALIYTHDYLTTRAQVRLYYRNTIVEKIDIFFANSLPFRGLNFFSQDIYQRQLFQTYIKNYIELTLLWQLVVDQSLECFHAAAVEKDGEVLVFAGLNGVGKTTLAIFLAQKHGYRLFADNYMLMSATEAFRSLDQARLEKSVLSNQSGMKEAGEFGFGKQMISIPEEMKSSLLSARIKAIYSVQRGETWQREKSSASEVIHTIRHAQTSHGESVSTAIASHIQPAASTTLSTLPQVEYYTLTLGNIVDLPTQYFL